MKSMDYTWKQFNEDAELLAKKVAGNNFEALLIITKGGLHLGAFLAQRLNIPYVDTVGIKSYTSGEKHVLEVTKEADWSKMPPRLLIVDDISDSGDTLQYIKDHYKAPTATLFKKRGTKYQPTYCINEIEDDVWVKFPWESEVKQ